MKNIDNHLDKLNSAIKVMREEADFYLVIQLFDKLKEFYKIAKHENSKTDIILISKNSISNPGYWIEFDNSNEDMEKMFTQAGIKFAHGISNIEHHLKLPLTIKEYMTLEDFVEAYTTENYQKEFLAYNLDMNLCETKGVNKMKI